MKKISLTQGKYALVDDEDYPSISRYKWQAVWGINAKSFYAITTKLPERKTIRMHRLIMGAPKGLVVDHINHDTLDNRKRNLRVVTSAENTRYQKLSSNNTSGYKGVTYRKDKKTKNWVAQIGTMKEGKQVGISIGHFATPQEAASAYNEMAKRMFGKFALLNKIK